MRSSKVAIWITLGVAIFALQFWLVYRVPYWGLRSEFPYSVLRSVQMPILLTVGFAVMVFSAKSATERRLFYSVIGASLAQIVTIKAMLWLDQPLLLLLVFFLNAFMTVHILRYGILVSAVEPS
jgi:hypothetical protein